MEVANTLAYHDTAAITAIKSFKVQITAEKKSRLLTKFMTRIQTKLLINSFNKIEQNREKFFTSLSFKTVTFC
jgi:hypothetical protein